MWRNREKMAIYKQRREASEEANPGDTLIFDFQPPYHKTINVCFLSCPVCGTLLWWPQQTNTGPLPSSLFSLSSFCRIPEKLPLNLPRVANSPLPELWFISVPRRQSPVPRWPDSCEGKHASLLCLDSTLLSVESKVCLTFIELHS